MRIVLAVFGTLAFVVVLISTLVFYPFAPYNISEVRTIPDAVCPLEDVEVTASLQIESGWDLKTLEVESKWEPVDGLRLVAVSGGTATIPEPEPELARRFKSPILRVAPPVPGEYRLHSEAELLGTFGKNNPVHGWPKVQVVEYKAVNTLTVLPETDPACEGGSS